MTCSSQVGRTELHSTHWASWVDHEQSSSRCWSTEGTGRSRSALTTSARTCRRRRVRPSASCSQKPTAEMQYSSAARPTKADLLPTPELKGHPHDESPAVD